MHRSPDQTPLAISAIVPLFNDAATVLATLESLARQSHRLAEIIIVDDLSTDQGVALCTDWAKTAPVAVSIHTLPEKGFAAGARNAGTAHAKSPWLLFMDADDVLEATYVEELVVRIVKRQSGVGFGAYYQIDGSGRRLGEPVTFQQIAAQEVFGYLICRNVISTSGLLIQRELFNLGGGFPTHRRLSEDWDLWLRVAQQNVDWAYLETPLLSVRRDAANTSSAPGPSHQAEREILGQYSVEVIVAAIGRRQLPWLTNQVDTAAVLFRLDHWEAGYEALQKAVVKKMASPALSFYRGVYSLHANQLELAQGQFEAVLHQDGNHGAALNNLAVLLALSGDQVEARRLLEQALTLRPQYLDARHNLAQLDGGATKSLADFKLTWRELRAVLPHYTLS